MIAPIRLALLVAAIAGSYAVGRAAPQHSREAAAVRSARAQQNTAIAARDFDRAASFWTEDVIIRSGLGLIIQGRSNYRSAFVADTTTVFHREPDRVDVSDNERWPLAFESGTWTGRAAADGRPLVRGRYAAQWIKRNGRWLIRAEVFVALGCAGPGCSRPLAVQ
jgi:ketosteroid isomerase-like protein